MPANKEEWQAMGRTMFRPIGIKLSNITMSERTRRYRLARAWTRNTASAKSELLVS